MGNMDIKQYVIAFIWPHDHPDLLEQESILCGFPKEGYGFIRIHLCFYIPYPLWAGNAHIFEQMNIKYDYKQGNSIISIKIDLKNK